VPVSLLFCEGNAGSPDARILGKLLAGRCELRPSGGKYGLGSLIKGARATIGKDAVFGILDRDFPDGWGAPIHSPVPWIASDHVRLGWRWERKEIENYLIDPDVVALALGAQAPPPDDYRCALERARDRLGIYQAARAALSECRRRFSPLSCSFGRARGRDKHPLPDDASEQVCRQGIEECVDAYNSKQSVTVARVSESFAERVPEFAAGGARHAHYLTAFAGKDLLWSLDQDLRDFGFTGVLPFQEKVLMGIQNSADDIGAWLPEWKALQDQVDAA